MGGPNSDDGTDTLILYIRILQYNLSTDWVQIPLVGKASSHITKRFVYFLKNMDDFTAEPFPIFLTVKRKFPAFFNSALCTLRKPTSATTTRNFFAGCSIAA
jgi:hypothetical protein